MDINFVDKKLEKYANDDRLMFRKLGTLRATKFKQRLNDLSNATTLEDVRDLPGNYHELRENRKGEWACSLDNPYRLIFIPQEDPIPEDEDGNYIWDKITAITIIEIIDYH
ncbi:MAG: type II toxin-antitoxin system RelE/ParE family toxin [Balneola sp.]|nr:type II toxin-antitoxin system RelE/ParE family toxin [Balneola sp.]MBO6651466.1 type II toxin-antitoxin system RelE/ParE family toxin [Balneola sp.]MBO6712497.1 type II toxin-antitoxin system RelE/ParE family toxin [Balneola sp.]MBO6801010.1 type II toxin-antitoxin system RelE/ParE family toxin [Balneola sp.]MBO6870682.1 type II toxin-antitoxin system RelE/ParE family toxin [Balneola sp.]